MSAELMIEKAKTIAQYAYVPYSKFRVGACIKTGNNELFVGCNVENASYGLATCAEASAISQMITAGQYDITAVAVIGLSCDQFLAPCGACRQRIMEFANAETIIHTANSQGHYESHLLSELLPLSFGPKFLENDHE